VKPETEHLIPKPEECITKEENHNSKYFPHEMNAQMLKI
jgi:hypothetical protein